MEHMGAVARSAAVIAVVITGLAQTAPAQNLFAPPFVTVSVTDDIYGPFSGSIESGASGSDAVLSWMSAGYFWAGNIDLTSQTGVILAEITTNANDIYVLNAPGSGDPAIGTNCMAGNSTACVIATSTPESLYGAVNSLNGGRGICCGSSDIEVAFSGAQAPVPGVGFLSFGIAASALYLRRRRKAA